MSPRKLFRRVMTLRLCGHKTTPIGMGLTQPLLLEPLEDRLAPAVWNQFNGNAQHTGISTVAAQPMDQILWSTSVSLAGDYFWHTGEPVFTPNDTVIVPVKVTSSGQQTGTANYELEAFNGGTGALLWTVTSEYISANNGWLPPYQPVYDAITNRVYFAGLGGTLEYISNPDDPGSSTPMPSVEAFYGTANYNANESAYNSSITIDTPLTVDNAGNVYFGFQETGSNPSGISDGGIARVSATGAGKYVTSTAATGAGSGAPAVGSAPALSNDFSTLYVAIADSAGSYLVGVSATTLTPESSALLSVPNAGTGVYLEGLSTAAPMVAPDGTVYMGVFASSYDGSRGFMTHYSADLSTEYAPGAFGWDDTPSIIPASMVPSYTGSSSYLILTKYNNYVAGETGSTGGNGVNEIAILDPNATELDPNNDPNPNLQVMKQVLTVTSPTEDSGYINSGYPDATREWCTNGTAVDPSSDSVFINNEDGYSYRWNLASDTITQAVEITNGYGEPYTPTSIGPNGVIYALNGGTLFALGGYSNYTFTTVSSLTPAVAGQPVTFTTTLASTSGGNVPTGSITYSYTSGVNDPLNSTPVTLGTVPLLNGVASLTTSALVPDHYHLIATYSGDSTDGYAAGSTTLEQVILANPTVSLSTSASPVLAGQSVTFTATVNPEGIFFVPIGTVSFMDGSTLLGTVSLNPLDQSTSPSSSQTATFTTSSLPAGNDSITAVYSGDLNFAGNASSALTQTVDQAPAFTNLAATAFTEGAAGTFTMSATGFPAPNFDVTTGTLPSGLTLNATMGILSGNPAAGTHGVYNLVITASNGISPNATQNFTLTINPPPAITTSSLPNWTINQPYSQTIGVTGGTAPITFAVTSGSLPAGLNFDSSTGSITGTPTTTTGSPFDFTITATDAENATSSQGYSVAINPAPAITTSTLPDWTINQSYSQTIGVTGGTAPITFAVSSGSLPTGLSLDSNTGAIAGTPTTTTGSPFSFTITATDAASARASQGYTVAINPLPSITTSTLPNWTVNQPYSQTIGVTGGTSPLTFAVSSGSLPTGLSLDSHTGAITGKPTSTSGSPFSFTISATDASSASASQIYTVTINPVLSITPAALPAATAQTPYDQTLTVSGGTTPYTTITITNFNGGVTGLTTSSITTNANTGTVTISGTPTTGGPLTFTANITDSVGATLIQNYTLTVDQAPDFTSSDSTTFTVGTSGSFTVAANGYPEPTFAAYGTLPSGVTLSSDGLLSGIPTGGSAGAYPIVIVATNGVSPDAIQSFTLTVDQAPYSLANSIVKVSSGSVNSGSTDTITLQAEDVYGNDETEGGLNVLFSLGSAMGGQGTFSSVTDDGNGTYTATFTGTMAGSNTITAKINSQSVTSVAPSIVVTPGPFSLANSFVTLSTGTIQSGNATTISLQTKDAYENDLSTGGLNVAFVLGSTLGAQGIFTSATYDGSGIYTATFTGTIAGSNTITATIDDQAVTSTAPSIAVTPGSFSLANSVVALSTGTIQSTSATTITLQAKDANGNDLTSGGLNVAFALGSTMGGQGTFSSVTDEGNGTYTATFIGTNAGSNTIKAKINSLAVTSAAPSITVIPGPFSLSNSFVTLSLGTIQSGSMTTITLHAEDGNGNDLITGGLDVTFALGAALGAQGTFSSTTDEGNGTYTATFTGSIAGSNTITAKINGLAVTSTAPAIAVIPGPFSLSNSFVALSLPSVQLGGESIITLQAEDAAGNKETTGGLTVAFALATPSGDQGTISPAIDNHNGTYSATFIGIADGGNVVEASIDRSALTSTGPAISVTGAAFSLTKSAITVSNASVQSGNTFTVKLQVKDAQGNPEMSGGLNVAFKTGTASGGQVTIGSVIDNGDGTYTAVLTGTLVGGNTIKATIDGQSVTAKAPAFKVAAGQFSLATSVIKLSSGTVESGQKTTITLQPEDAAGNKLNLRDLIVGFKTGDGTGNGTITAAKYNPNGTYTATFTGTTAGGNTIVTTVGSQTASGPVITVKPGPGTAKKSVVQVSSTSVAVGDTFTVTLQAVDADDNQDVTGGLRVAFAMGNKNGAKGKFSKVKDNGNGTYSAFFTATIAGTNTIVATIGGVKVTLASPTITVTA